MRDVRILAAAGAFAALIAVGPLALDAAPLAPHGAATRADDDAAVRVAVDTPTAAPRQRNELQPQRERDGVAEAAAKEAAAVAPTLRVRLHGVSTAVPWHAPLTIAVTGHDEAAHWQEHHASATPDANGSAAFVLPEWSRLHTTTLRIEGEAPGYRWLRREWQGALDFAEEIVVAVRATATVTGRVVDEHGAPVRAEVQLFRRGRGPEDVALMATTSDPDGTWQLDVPTSVPLEVVAEWTCVSAIVFDCSEWPHLLTASAPVEVCPGASLAVGDLVLRTAPRIRGTVRWSDGEPAAGVMLWLEPPGDSWRAYGSHPVAVASADGRWNLPTIPGTRADVVAAVGAVSSGCEPRRAAAPGESIDFVLPRPVVVREVGGPATASSVFEVNDSEVCVSAPHQLCLVPVRTMRVRAVHEHRRSRWREIGPADAGTEIDLELVDELRSVRFVYGRFEALRVDLRWQRADGIAGSQQATRKDLAGDLQAFLEPGRYHFTLSPLPVGSGDHSDAAFLLPGECDVLVGTEDVCVGLPAEHGGKLRITATDRWGAPLSGRCIAIGGGERVEIAVDAPDELLRSEGCEPEVCPRVLRPGSCELQLVFPGHGATSRTVTIEPRRITDVRVRL